MRSRTSRPRPARSSKNTEDAQGAQKRPRPRQHCPGLVRSLHRAAEYLSPMQSNRRQRSALRSLVAVAAQALADALDALTGNDFVMGDHHFTLQVIAAVRGPAVGGGFALAAAADIRICSPDAMFLAPFVKLGVSVGDMGCPGCCPASSAPGRRRSRVWEPAAWASLTKPVAR